MKFILLVFALIQITYVEPRYVLVPSCQCMLNSIPPAVQVHSCPKPTLSIPYGRCSHAYRTNAMPEVHTYSELHSKAYPQRGPQLHDERISYKRDYYPGHYEEDLEIFYEDEDHEVRRRRSVLSGDEHKRFADVEDWEGEGEVSEDASYEERQAQADWVRQGDLQLPNVVQQADVKSLEKDEDKNEGDKQQLNLQVTGDDSDRTDDGKSAIVKKSKRSIQEQQFQYQYRPSNQGYCSVLDRYSKFGNHLHPNVHADDCTISKNLFFGCDMDLEKGNLEQTQRKTRKVPKTFTQKIDQLKVKNEKLKNKLKQSKSKAKKINKLENSLKKDNRFKNKRKNEEERLERELEATATCPCGSFDGNGACRCQMQPTLIKYLPYPAPPPRVYRQYAPPMHHTYYTH